MRGKNVNTKDKLQVVGADLVSAICWDAYKRGQATFSIWSDSYAKICKVGILYEFIIGTFCLTLSNNNLLTMRIPSPVLLFYFGIISELFRN